MTRFSEAAVVSKARSMYGKRLRQSDWDHLINCATLKDVASYLKNSTAYHEVLSKAPSESIHRYELETILAERLIQESAKLSHYDFTGKWSILHFLVSNLEIQNITRAFIRVMSHVEPEYHEPSAYLRNISNIDQRRLDQADSFSEIMAVLEKTPYYSVLKSFPYDEQTGLDYSRLEDYLEEHLYQKVYDFIDHKAGNNAKTELHRFFDETMDLNNYARLMRLKKHFKTSEQEIREKLLPFGTISNEKLEEMIVAETDTKVTELMRETRTGKRTLMLPHSTPDELLRIVQYKNCRKNLFYSEVSGVVLLSYVLLLQNEITDLIHLIEGLRYGLTKPEIRKLIESYEYI